VAEPDKDRHAGKSFGRDSTIFEDLRAQQEENSQGRYGPFADKDIAEVAEFLVECVGKGEADRFLKLKRVRTSSARCSASLLMPWCSTDTLECRSTMAQCKPVLRDSGLSTAVTTRSSSV
jgi:hypothetical protein